MLKKQLYIILLFSLLINTIYANEDDFEILLGQWYGATRQYYETFDTLYSFKITKNNNLYTLEYNYLGTETVTGTITRNFDDADVRAGQSHIFYFNANNETFTFYINNMNGGLANNILNHSNYVALNGLWIATMVSDKFYDYWSFIKKCDIVRILTGGERPLIGYINNSGVRFRRDYSLSSDIIRTFNINENVRIIGISPSIEIINGNYEYWYNVITSSGERGWVYGAYLELDGRVMYSYDRWPEVSEN